MWSVCTGASVRAGQPDQVRPGHVAADVCVQLYWCVFQSHRAWLCATIYGTKCSLLARTGLVKVCVGCT